MMMMMAMTILWYLAWLLGQREETIALPQEEFILCAENTVSP
jgi:hypothetical protein